MKHLSLWVRVASIFLLIVSIAVTASAQMVSSIDWYDDQDEAFAQATREERPVMVLITGGIWCDPCRWFEENTLSDPALSALVRSAWIPLRILDTDPASLDWAVTVLPTLVLVDQDGNELDRMAGAITARAVRERMVAHDQLSPTEVEGSQRRDNLNGAVFRLGAGMIWNDGGALWYTQDVGLAPQFEEYDRDEEFLYLRDRSSATILAMTIAVGTTQRALWRWDGATNEWLEVGQLQRTN